MVCEVLEGRRLLSNTVLRIASYNIEDDINGATTPLPGLFQVLEGIGEEKVQGNVRPLDILGLEETTSNSTTVAPIVTALNSYYSGTGVAAVYAQSTFQGTSSGGDVADGNGPNAIVYNTSTLTLLQSAGVGSPGGSSNGEYRQPVRYEFQPVGDVGNNGIFFIYVLHTKSGSGSTNASYRAEEATIVRNNEANLPANAAVIYMGDLNATYPEAEFTEFGTPSTGTGATTVTQGSATDPVSYSSSVQYLSESDTDLHYRDDYQLDTSNVLGDTGNLNYISGSFHVFANNGTTPTYGSVNSGSDTALNSDLVQDGGTFYSASQLYSYLTTASDHLPVVSDYTIPTTPVIGSFSASPSPVASGSNVTLAASNVTETGLPISSVSFYSETNGTSGLQVGSDTLLGTGTLSGSTYSLTTSTTGLATGSQTYYAVATDSNGNTSAASSTAVTIKPVMGTPTIGSFVASPSTVPSGTAFSLIAGSVSDVGSTVTSVAFYEESNGTTGLQTGSDTYLGTGTQNGTSWTLSNISSAGLAAGSYTFYAVATDASSATSAASSTTLAVTQGSPVIGTFTVSPGSVNVGATVTLTAIGVTDTGGTITGVNFYRESNGTAGLQTGSDTFVGAGTQNGTTWSTTASTASLAAGTYTYYAVAADSTGAKSSTASGTVSVYTLPAWLAAGSHAIFNPSTETLVVSSGLATIIADPKTYGDLPNITVNSTVSSPAELLINPTNSDVDIHIGGLTLNGTAVAEVASVGSSRSYIYHNTLVLGTLNSINDPTLMIASTAKLDMEDNDLIIHTGSNDAGGDTELTTVQGFVQTGRDGGAWDGNGLTSTAAMTQDNNDGIESVQLGPVDNNDLASPFSSWQVGNASETLGANDIIVKYTYTGDFNLDGEVTATDDGTLGLNYDGGASTGNEWADGDTNGDGLLNAQDVSNFGTAFGNGTGSSTADDPTRL